MGGNPGLDNGEWMMRAQRECQADPYRRALQAEWAQIAAAQAQYLRMAHPEPEPEDTTGLKLLDEFLQRRKRDGTED